MNIRRIIPCLDVTNGRVVKGVRFQNLRDAGDPVELAARYDAAGADELVFLDISATSEGRETLLDLVRATAAQLSIPLIVGGGVRSVETMGRLLEAGADKVSVSSAAVERPALLQECAEAFGSARLILAIDAQRRKNGGWEVYTRGGQTPTGLDAVAWARRAVELGVGEMLLTSMDGDGTQSGYDLELTRAVAEAAGVPVIASGGAGTLEHLYQAVTTGMADGVLAASMFHNGTYTITEAKEYLAARGVPVRMVPQSHN